MGQGKQYYKSPFALKFRTPEEEAKPLPKPPKTYYGLETPEGLDVTPFGLKMPVPVQLSPEEEAYAQAERAKSPAWKRRVEGFIGGYTGADSLLNYQSPGQIDPETERALGLGEMTSFVGPG